MSPFVRHVVQHLGTLQHQDKPTTGERKVLAEAAERLLIEAERLLQGVRYEAYAVASGHQVEVRARAKGKGVKQFTVHRQWDNSTSSHRMLAGAVIAAVVSVPWDKSPLCPVRDSKLPGYEENPAKHAAVECVRAQLMKDAGKDVQAALDALRPDRATELKAQTQLQANRARSDATAKKFALERLSESMRSYDFSREDVVLAWEMSQVSRVMES